MHFDWVNSGDYIRKLPGYNGPYDREGGENNEPSL